MKTLIVPVSGGKDSQVCLSLAMKEFAQLGFEKVVAVHQSTGYDHPLTYQHLRDTASFYGIPIVYTRSERYGDMWGFLKEAGYFPNVAARGCTERLKQEPFARWLLANDYNETNCEIWMGMRGSDESAARTTKYGGLEDGDIFDLGSISDFYAGGWRKPLSTINCRLRVVTWTTAQIFAYAAEEGAPLNPLYGRGHQRVGCYPCLLARKSEWVAAGQDPVGRSHIIKLIRQKDQWAAENNHRKLSKTVHPVWDVRKFLDLAEGEALPELQPGECGWCSI